MGGGVRIHEAIARVLIALSLTASTFVPWSSEGTLLVAAAEVGIDGQVVGPEGDPDPLRCIERVAIPSIDNALEVYRCGSRVTTVPSRADPVARARQQRIDADPRHFVRPVIGYFSQFVQGAHTGIDIAAPFGSIITAADEGEVTFVGWRPVGGRAVCVLHDRGVESCYYHSSLALVRAGQRVARGEPVALVGMTGLTTGPHVHWEVKSSGLIVDPLKR